MTQISINIKDVFKQIVIPAPTIAPRGLKQFHTILEDKAAARTFFYQDPEMIVRFLSALRNTDGDEAKFLLVQALSSPLVVYRLLENGQTEFVLNTLETLNSDQITQVLSEENSIYGMVRNNQSTFALNILDNLSFEQITKILSVPEVVEKLAYYHAEFIVETLDKLNNNQMVQVLSTDSVRDRLAREGYREWVEAKQGQIATMRASQPATAKPPHPSGME